jgi:hypothetical protein
MQLVNNPCSLESSHCSATGLPKNQNGFWSDSLTSLAASSQRCLNPSPYIISMINAAKEKRERKTAKRRRRRERKVRKRVEQNAAEESVNCLSFSFWCCWSPAELFRELLFGCRIDCSLAVSKLFYCVIMSVYQAAQRRSDLVILINMRKNKRLAVFFQALACISM